jgi:hypothetical protein
MTSMEAAFDGLTLAEASAVAPVPVDDIHQLTQSIAVRVATYLPPGTPPPTEINMYLLPEGYEQWIDADGKSCVQTREGSVKRYTRHRALRYTLRAMDELEQSMRENTRLEAAARRIGHLYRHIADNYAGIIRHRRDELVDYAVSVCQQERST